MSKIFMAFFAGVDYGKPNSSLPPFYESFISELQARNHELAVIPHNIFGTQEWGGGQHNIAASLTHFNPICAYFSTTPSTTSATL